MTADLYTLPDLPCDYSALEPYISARIMELHHDKHHAGYVKGANTALERPHEIREKGDFSAISMLEKNLTFNVSGHVLHSAFWTNLSPRGGGEPQGDLAELFDATFGGFLSFRQQMAEAFSRRSQAQTLVALAGGRRELLEQRLADFQNRLHHAGNDFAATEGLRVVEAALRLVPRTGER